MLKANWAKVFACIKTERYPKAAWPNMASLLRLKISHEDDVLIAGGCDLK
jgi:hypothetical protein